jgi:hypothetical protein
MNLWNRDVAFLLALIVSGALLAVLHIALSLRSLRAARLPPALRYLAWLPPLTPVAGFIGGAPVLAVLWCIVLAAYVVLRSLA